MEKPKPCPICGRDAYISRDVIEGQFIGYSVGCPKYCINDGIHGIHTLQEARRGEGYKVSATTKEKAIKAWNVKVNEAIAKGKAKMYVPVAELEKTRRALACMWFAYINKDEELPHEFERKAEEMAEELLGPFNGYVMTYLLKEDE